MKQNSNGLLKNTITLYIRMLFSACVNVYISRIILKVLGIEDFGIYSVIGGIVVLLGFINSSMAGSTSRFLSIAIGEQDEKKLCDTYNAAKHLHFSIAVLILVIGEVVGLLLVNSYIEIPEGREVVANMVYQLSLASVLFSIVQVPFSALIISMERMDVYAKIEIANVLMKLGVVLLLPLFNTDLLLLYSFLLLIVALIVYLVYKIYCKQAYKTLKYDKTIQIDIIRPMLIYSGWDMLGWGGVSLSTQGRQILINKFFGVSFNAANGLASTASGTIQAFTNNVIMAFRPRIMKSYACHNYLEMQRLIELAVIGTVFLMSIIFVPMIISMGYLLNIWLAEVPPYTLDFCRLLLILQFFEAINTVVKIGIQASGVLRNFTILGFIIHLSNLIITYTLYLNGMPATITYIVAIGLCILNVAVNLLFVKHLIPLTDINSLFFICGAGILICFMGYLCAFFINSIINSQLLSFISILAVNFVIIFILSFICHYSKIKPVLSSLLIRR